MDFSLSAEQRLLISTVRRFIAKELRSLWNKRLKIRAYLQKRPAISSLKSARLYASNMPVELGGGGLSALDTMLLEEQFGHTSDILIRRAFGNVYEVLLECRGEQIDICCALHHKSHRLTASLSQRHSMRRLSRPEHEKPLRAGNYRGPNILSAMGFIRIFLLFQQSLTLAKYVISALVG
ncbi:MAG: acyl-CoA dehydrogenase family protein [Deinococcales bacterium]